jgi:hypothetical protein
MPNAAPPAHPAARRRTADSSTPPAVRRATGGAAAAGVPALAPSPQASPTLTGVPSSWTGLGPLLDSAGERAPADALTLAAVVSGTSRSDGAQAVDLSGIWALPAGMAAARSTSVIRALDDKGRMQLPIDADAATRLPAERDGALVTVFLPGSSERPRPNFASVPLPLDARGRLTVTAGVRREAGIPEGADVLAVVDPDRRTVTLTAASRLAAGITGLLDTLRRPVLAPAGARAVPGDSDGSAVPALDAAPPATSGGAADDENAGTDSAGRLRIVR